MEYSELEEHPWWIWFEHLGGVTGLGAAPLSLVGLVAPVELIGSVISLTLLSLSMVAGVVTLVIGVTGNIDLSFN